MKPYIVQFFDSATHLFATKIARMVTGALVHDRNFKIVATNTQEYVKTLVNGSNKNVGNDLKLTQKKQSKAIT